MREVLINRKEEFKDYMRRTSKNKRYALAMFITGLLSVNVVGEGTFLVVMLMLGLPLFFSKENIF